MSGEDGQVERRTAAVAKIAEAVPLIDRAGMRADVLAMATNADKKALNVWEQERNWPLSFKLLDLRDDCRAFAADLERREGGR